MKARSWIPPDGTQAVREKASERRCGVEATGIRRKDALLGGLEPGVGIAYRVQHFGFQIVRGELAPEPASGSIDGRIAALEGRLPVRPALECIDPKRHAFGMLEHPFHVMTGSEPKLFQSHALPRCPTVTVARPASQHVRMSVRRCAIDLRIFRSVSRIERADLNAPFRVGAVPGPPDAKPGLGVARLGEILRRVNGASGHSLCGVSSRLERRSRFTRRQT